MAETYGRAYTQKRTANKRSEENRIRTQMGLSPNHFINRQCLNCDRHFKAYGKFNRLCDLCHQIFKGGNLNG